MNLCNENVLKYPQIARNGTESKIPYIESHSNAYRRLQKRLYMHQPRGSSINPCEYEKGRGRARGSPKFHIITY